jgi:hypothetical protein
MKLLFFCVELQECFILVILVAAEELMMLL